ncbi:MAG: glycosyltransferase family 4 protein [Anaerolineales bacterium]|nr:glycosyltransferase family 4 protein [Anaerolineales bacterium]
MLVINARFQTRPITGVERYAHELTCRIRMGIRYEIPTLAWRGGRGHLWEQFILPARVAPHEWLFSPANIGPALVRRQIVTIHDLSPLEHPEWFSLGFAWWYRLLWPILARRVRGILTDSDFSRARIIARLSVPPEKVVAIPTGVNTNMFHPVSIPEQDHVRTKYSLPNEFILFVGSLQPRKNLRLLLTTWEHLRTEFPHLDLVIAGTSGPQFQGSALHSSLRTSITSPSFLGYVPDDDLPALYSAALGLIHPGLYEGSGLTLLEAMACGCPVLAANNTALPEVVGAAGVFFDPYASDDLANKLRDFLENEPLRAKIRQLGDERVMSFTWERVSDEFHKALQHFQVW